MPIQNALRNLRSFAIIFGPSLLLDIAIGAATFSAARALVASRKGKGPPPRITPLVAVGAIVPWVYALAIRPRVLSWGATGEETRRPLSGDERVSRPTYQTTRAVTIHAPAGEVWRWIVQLGQGRGGYYSYDWLENMAGLEIHSVDDIQPALQDLRVGDLVRMAPESAGPEAGFRVVALEPERALVLSGPGGMSWALVLEPLDERRTRLLARLRAGKNPAPGSGRVAESTSRLLGALSTALTLELPYFVMESRMLEGIKLRAEHRYREQQLEKEAPHVARRAPLSSHMESLPA